MKSIFKIRIQILLTGAGLSVSTTLAQSWQIVDDFQLVPGLPASSGDIGTGVDGATLYSVGSSDLDTAGNRAAVVRMSVNSGASWTTRNVYSEPGWPFAHYRGLATASDGTLFVAGEVWDGVPNTGTKTWIVRQSADGGASWLTVDAFSQGPTAKPSCGDIKVNPATGDVFAVGIGNTGSTAGFYWAVRKRAANSATFTTVDMVGAAPINEARAVAFHPTAGVFVVGRMGDGQKYVWSVRRSMNGGATWTTVDTFRSSANTYSAAEAIAVSSSGIIYTAGRSQELVKNKLVYNWVVRRSINGGTTWTTVDKFGTNTGEPSATGMAIDPSGNVFVTGYSAGTKRMLVRKGIPGSNGNMSWVTSDDFQLVAGQEAVGNGVASDSFGNIFVAGRGNDVTGAARWLVHKLAP